MHWQQCVVFQSLWYRARSFDEEALSKTEYSLTFQSLWYRARSFDYKKCVNVCNDLFQSLWYRARSFDCLSGWVTWFVGSFNPFDTGQGLSTLERVSIRKPRRVSIPLIQGKVFRLILNDTQKDQAKFQSLWYRARSFDVLGNAIHNLQKSFNPFDTGQGLSTS